MDPYEVLANPIIPTLPVFITLAFLVTIAFIFCPLYFFTNTTRRKKENLCFHLSREGAANNLIFCSQEILQNKVIGIDGIHRKIMILEKIRNRYDCSVICLDEVQTCELVEKNFRAIGLQFEFKKHSQPASIIFYDSLINSKRELELLKAKAEYWSVMLSKMLIANVRARA